MIIHTHFINSIAKHEKEEKDNIVVFLKDNAYASGTFRSFNEVYELTKRVGFGCIPVYPQFLLRIHRRREFGFWAMPTYESNKGENYGETSESFQNENYKNLNDYETKMGFVVPQKSTFQPACFGGFFAVKKGNMLNQPEGVWKKFQTSLERGDNIIEGHYAERLWESLFIDTALAPAIDEYARHYSNGTIVDLEILDIKFPPECTWECYLQSNPDLQGEGLDEKDGATNHYILYGFHKGNSCMCNHEEGSQQKDSIDEGKMAPPEPNKNFSSSKEIKINDNVDTNQNAFAEKEDDDVKTFKSRPVVEDKQEEDDNHRSDDLTMIPKKNNDNDLNITMKQDDDMTMEQKAHLLVMS